MDPSIKTIDDLAHLFRLPSWEKIEEMNLDHLAGASAGIEDEDERTAAEDRASAELYRQWHGAVMAVAESLLGEHKLALVPRFTPSNKRLASANTPAYQFRIMAPEGWAAAALRIVQTINGIGEFHFASAGEFARVNSSTLRAATLSHLGYARRYPDVYGSASAARIFERAFS